MSQPQPTSIWMQNGYVTPLSGLKPEQIDIEVIALGLSRIPRFLGQTDRDQPALSVAQHSCHVQAMAAQLDLDPDLRAVALLHDAAEAILCEVVRPIKHSGFMQSYLDAERHVQSVIWRRFDLTEAAHDWADLVKGLDRAALAREKCALIPRDAGKWPGVPDLPRQPMTCLPAPEAEGRFLEVAALLGLCDS